VANNERHAQVLHEHGLKATRHRLAILETLHELGGTADASELYARLEEEDELHKTTLYRNLDVLEEIGLVRRIFDGERAFRYELACEHGPAVHPHFRCRQCGKLFCLEPVDLRGVWDLLSEDQGFEAESAEVRIVGLCSECRAEGGAAE
jgi:Fur family ferric uptake transcriptional regulator